jgi:hypothetical protein
MVCPAYNHPCFLSTIEASKSPTGWAILFHLQDSVDFAGEFNDVKRLSYEILSAGFEQLSDFILFYYAAYDDNLDVFEFGILSYRLADDVAVDVGQHIIEQYQVTYNRAISGQAETAE